MRSRLLRWFFNVLVKLLSRARAEGLHNLPAHRPYLLVSNHMSMADIPLGYVFLGTEDTAGWVANKWRYNLLLWPILRLGRGIFIRRGEIDRAALEAAADWLKQGKVFALAPEGTRSRNGQLQRGKTGAAYLAQLAQVPIVPAAVIGTDQTFQHLLRLRRPELLLRVGKPFNLPPLDPSERSAGLRRQADEIMCRIAALLPPRYWGAYADHPRLRELLAESPNGSGLASSLLDASESPGIESSRGTQPP